MGCTESRSGKGSCFRRSRGASSTKRKLTSESNPIHVAVIPKNKSGGNCAECNKRTAKDKEKEKEKEKTPSNSKSKRAAYRRSKDKAQPSSGNNVNKQDVCCCSNNKTQPTTSSRGGTQAGTSSGANKKSGKASNKKKFFFRKNKKDNPSSNSYPKLPSAPVFEPVVPSSIRHNYVAPLDSPPKEEYVAPQEPFPVTSIAMAETVLTVGNRVTWAENTTSSESQLGPPKLVNSSIEHTRGGTTDQSVIKSTDMGMESGLTIANCSNSTPREAVGRTRVATKQQNLVQGGLGVPDTGSSGEDIRSNNFGIITASNATSEQRAYARLMGYDLLTDRQIYLISLWVDDAVQVLRTTPPDALLPPIPIPGSASTAMNTTNFSLAFTPEGEGFPNGHPPQIKLPQEEASSSYGMTVPGTSQISGDAIQVEQPLHRGANAGGIASISVIAGSLADCFIVPRSLGYMTEAIENPNIVTPLTLENISKLQREIQKDKTVSFSYVPAPAPT